MSVTLDLDLTGMTDAEAQAAFQQWEDALRSAVTSKEFDESLHPRDEAGRFAYAGGSASATGFSAEQKLDIQDRKDANAMVNAYLKPVTWEDGKAYEQALKLSDAVQDAANAAKEAFAASGMLYEREAALKESMEQQIAGQLVERLSPEAINSFVPDYEATASFQIALGTITIDENGHQSYGLGYPEKFDDIKGKFLDAIGTTPPDALVASMRELDAPGGTGMDIAQQWWDSYRANVEAATDASDLVVAARNLGSVYSEVGDSVRNAMVTVAPLSDAQMKDVVYGKVRETIDAWASSASDTNPRSMALQDAAKEVFGATTNSTFEDLHRGLEPVSDAQREIYKAMVGVIYENTQKFLADNGITEVSLHRGMNFAQEFGGSVAAKLETIATSNNMEKIGQTKESGHAFPVVTAYVGESVPVESNPLSSFATRVGSALAFGGNGSFFDSGAMMIHTTVPAKDIFSMPATGPGCLNEDEVIVIARPNMTATVEMKINGPSS